jgi:exodeoxyribonuclease VII large subunit
MSQNAAPVWTVAQLTRWIKQLLETQNWQIWIKGEISNLRATARGHVYFTLKDEQAQLSCVAFSGNAGSFTQSLQEGRQVLAWGEISVYEQRGNYQLIVRHMMDDGVGKIQQEFERLRKQLTEEGLFKAERKKPLPRVPKTVGFLTSETGAAIHDFISNLHGRGWRGRILLIPAVVQGVDAPASLRSGLQLAKRIEDLELLVIGRGGGSLEDLSCFNNEQLVRDVAAFPKPIISAVGHETDTVLTDFAADIRAETPTAAAAIILNDYLEYQQRALSGVQELQYWMDHHLHQMEIQLKHNQQRLQVFRPSRLIEEREQYLDDLLNRLRVGAQRNFLDLSDRIREYRQRLITGAAYSQLTLHKSRSLHLFEKLQTLVFNQFELLKNRTIEAQERLSSASLPQTLARGYSITTNASGKVVRSAKDLKSGDSIQNRFPDGSVDSIVQ